MGDGNDDHDDDYDDDEMTSLDGQEIMLGLDFSSLEISGIQDEDDEGIKTSESLPKKNCNDDDKDDTKLYDPSVIESLLVYEDCRPPATESNFQNLYANFDYKSGYIKATCVRAMLNIAGNTILKNKLRALCVKFRKMHVSSLKYE